MNNKKVSREEIEILMKKIETLTNLMKLCRSNFDPCKERLDAQDVTVAGLKLEQDEL